MLAAAPVHAGQPAHQDKALEAQLLASMQVLSSDDFAGREPGTPGETKTLRWLARAWFDAGLVSGTNDPGHPWFAPVTLVAREPVLSAARFTRRGRPVSLPADQVLVLTSGRRGLVQGAPLYFVGRAKGAVPPRTELAGRVAVVLDGAAPGKGPDATHLRQRQLDLLAGGALAVLTVLDGGRSMADVSARRGKGGYALAAQGGEDDLESFITAAGMDSLLTGGAAGRLADMQAEAARADFQPHLLDISTSMEASNRETQVNTHNLIGRLPGRHPEAGAVLLLAHWDHFGTCAPADAPHRICNGAIDNASGLAALTAIARRLAKQPQPMDRDVIFLATTAEEMGLLGAEAFAESPPLPLGRIVGALNLDSVAIAPAGTPLGIVGKGMTPLDGAIAAVAKAQHYALSDSTAPNAYIRRQDGWALMAYDVPAVMVTSAYGDIARLERFFATDYHKPADVVKPTIELGGMALDVAFHVELVKYLADPRRYAAPRS